MPGTRPRYPTSWSSPAGSSMPASGPSGAEDARYRSLEQRYNDLSATVDKMHVTLERLVYLYKSDRAQNLQRDQQQQYNETVMRLNAQLMQQARLHTEERLKWEKERKQFKALLERCQTELRTSSTSSNASTKTIGLKYTVNPTDSVEPYRCLGCGTTHESEAKLRFHQTNECHRFPNYACHLCTKKFFHRGNYRRHSATVHGIVNGKKIMNVQQLESKLQDAKAEQATEKNRDKTSKQVSGVFSTSTKEHLASLNRMRLIVEKINSPEEEMFLPVADNKDKCDSSVRGATKPTKLQQQEPNVRAEKTTEKNSTLERESDASSGGSFKKELSHLKRFLYEERHATDLQFLDDSEDKYSSDWASSEENEATGWEFVDSEVRVKENN